MTIHDPHFYDSIRAGGKESVFESYFYFEGLSAKLGGHRYEIIDGKNAIKIQEDPKKVTGWGIVKNIVKALSLFTIVVPVAMYIGQRIERRKQQYKVIKDDSQITHPTIQNTNKVGNKVLRVESSSLEFSHPTLKDTVESKKQKTNAFTSDALNTIREFKTLLMSRDPRVEITYGNEQNDIQTLTGFIDGNPFELQYYKNYKVSTWKFEKKGEKYELNEYREGAYNGPKTEGFIERKRILMGGAKLYIEKLSAEPEKKKLVLQKLDELENLFTSEIRKDAYKILPDRILDPDKKIGEAHYKQVHDKAEQLLSQLAKDIQYVIHEKIDEGFDINALAEAEKDFVVHRGRPVILNTYFVEGQQFFSMQQPVRSPYVNEEGKLSKRTVLPSTVRNREGLANYVTTSFGEITQKGDLYSAQTFFEGTRHSSYPPIAIKNSYQRVGIACRNCKQNLTDLAALRLKAQPDLETSEEHPLTVPLRSMLLLTPKKIDRIRNRSHFVTGKWTGESETTQLKESALALKIYNGRSFQINVEGQTVWIKPEISFMNLGANPMALEKGVGGLLADPEALTAYNAKGFIEFDQEVFHFLKSHLKDDPLLHELLDKMHVVSGGQDVERMRSEIESLQKDSNIKDLYARLEELMEASLSHPASKQIKKEIDKVRLEIDQMELDLYERYKKYLKVKSKIFHEKREQISSLFEMCKTQLNIRLKTVSGVEENELLHLQNVMIKYERALNIFYTKSFKNAETLLDFQAQYIEIQEMLSNFVEFFCKSAEDRTGRMDDKIQENKIFEALKGRPPTEEDQAYIDEKIAPYVHAYSTSQNNTEQNSGARGEQISVIVNRHLPATLDKKHAHLAKGVIKKAKLMKPSFNFTILNNERRMK